MTSAAGEIERVFKSEGTRLLAGLIRMFDGDFDAAEDVLQDAYLQAVKLWDERGVAENPAAWLFSVARNRALDALRRRKHQPRPSGELPEVPVEFAAEEVLSAREFPDDRLRLLFTCCHPALAPEAQVTLSLRTISGLTVPEIARAFLEPETTTAQRIVRAKKKIREAKIPYEVPSASDLPARLDGVLSVVYLVYNEGYLASAGDALARKELTTEAISLGRLLVELLPEEPEVLGLCALMLLHESRADARHGSDGELVTLEEQDRSRWRVPLISEGLEVLERSLELRRRAAATGPLPASGPYQLQAAIAALHAQAPSADVTDWKQIRALYRALLRVAPSPVIELNAAVALAMAGDIEGGLAWLDRIEAQADLPRYHLLPAARADLLRRSGRHLEARKQYEAALALTANSRERAYLERRLRELEQAT